MAVTFRPKVAHKRPMAISLFMGDESRKEKVTPRGIFASTKPINIETAEQEQKGVTMPNNEASTWPIYLFLPVKIFLIFSTGRYERIKVTIKTIRLSIKIIFTKS